MDAILKLPFIQITGALHVLVVTWSLDHVPSTRFVPRSHDCSTPVLAAASVLHRTVQGPQVQVTLTPEVLTRH